MKLVILMYLQEDEGCVDRLLTANQIPIYSRLDVEGIASGAAPGWYGESTPYASEMIVTIVPDDAAARLLEAVAECRGVQDPQHPIRALQLPVERETACRCE
ncbi:MAG: hypothetical protein PVF05_09250 [Gemmatimonadales bacterium]